MVQFVNSLTATLVVIAAAVATASGSNVAESVARRAATMGDARPYAPELFARGGFEADNAEIVSQAKRELLADQHEATLEPRARHQVCYADQSCNDDQYCSTKRNRCYRRLNIRVPCTRDYACASGYCGRATGECALQKENGRICFGANEACSSGYCSVRDNICKSRKYEGALCIVSDGCQPGLECVNNHCVIPSDTTTSSTSSADGTSPSGTPQKKRQLAPAAQATPAL